MGIKKLGVNRGLVKTVFLLADGARLPASSIIKCKNSDASVGVDRAVAIIGIHITKLKLAIIDDVCVITISASTGLPVYLCNDGWHIPMSRKL
jgi:hypothetical protein